MYLAGDFVCITAPTIKYNSLPPGSRVYDVTCQGQRYDCLFMLATMDSSGLAQTSPLPPFDTVRPSGRAPQLPIVLTDLHAGEVKAPETSGQVLVEFRIPLSS